MDEDTTTTTTDQPTASQEEVTQDPHLSIKVVDQDGNEIYFKIKHTTHLGKLMTAWCNKTGVGETSVRFLFDGERVKNDATPNDMDMEDGDIIDAVLQQTGGGPDLARTLADKTDCYFCHNKLDTKALFPFRAANHDELLARDGGAPMYAACFECAVQNADKFRNVEGEKIARLKE